MRVARISGFWLVFWAEFGKTGRSAPTFLDQFSITTVLPIRIPARTRYRSTSRGSGAWLPSGLVLAPAALVPPLLLPVSEPPWVTV